MEDIITLKLSTQDKKILKRLAQKERLTLSAYVRTKMLAGYENNTIKEFK